MTRNPKENNLFIIRHKRIVVNKNLRNQRILPLSVFDSFKNRERIRQNNKLFTERKLDRAETSINCSSFCRKNRGTIGKAICKGNSRTYSSCSSIEVLLQVKPSVKNFLTYTHLPQQRGQMSGHFKFPLFHKKGKNKS